MRSFIYEYTENQLNEHVCLLNFRVFMSKIVLKNGINRNGRPHYEVSLGDGLRVVSTVIDNTTTVNMFKKN